MEWLGPHHARRCDSWPERPRQYGQQPYWSRTIAPEASARGASSGQEDDLDGVTIYRIAFGTDTRPDPWQQALMDDAWPKVLIAPTGSGKTAAVTLG